MCGVDFWNLYFDSLIYRSILLQVSHLKYGRYVVSLKMRKCEFYIYFLFRIILALLVPASSSINFRVSISISTKQNQTKNSSQDFSQECVDSIDQLEKINYTFTILHLLIHEHISLLYFSFLSLIMNVCSFCNIYIPK